VDPGLQRPGGVDSLWEYRHDIIRAEFIASLGWRRVTVVAGHR